MADPMGDIDAAASPSSQNSPEDPGHPEVLKDAIYRSTTPMRMVSMAEQCPGSTVEMVNNSFMDDVAQYRKGGIPEPAHQTELKRVLNQAMGSVPNDQTPLIGRQDSDPKGG